MPSINNYTTQTGRVGEHTTSGSKSVKERFSFKVEENPYLTGRIFILDLYETAILLINCLWVHLFWILKDL